jgi:hypothetical protein
MNSSSGSRRQRPGHYCVGCERWFADFWEFKRHQDTCRPVVDLTDARPDDGGPERTARDQD